MHTASDAHACVDYVHDASQSCAQISLKSGEKQARSVRMDLLLCPVYHSRLATGSPTADTWCCNTMLRQLNTPEFALDAACP